MLRGLIKTGTAWALHCTNSHQWIASLAGSAKVPVVIGYHRVVEDYPSAAARTIPAMCVSRAMLQRHLEWLGRRFRFVSLDKLGARLSWGDRFDEPVAAITFDDGYRDVYENAFPLLQKKGIPAAVFVCTGLVGTSRLLVHDELYLLLERAFAKWQRASRGFGRFLLGLGVWLPGLDRMEGLSSDPFLAMQVLLNGLPQSEVCRVIQALRNEVEIEESGLEPLLPMTWEMVTRMRAAGITIGSHTKSHALLTNENWQRTGEEAAQSRV